MRKFFVSDVPVSDYRDLSDYDKVFTDALRYADVPRVISDSASLSSCDEKFISRLDLSQKWFPLPQIPATKMSIEPNYRREPEDKRPSWYGHCMDRVFL